MDAVAAQERSGMVMGRMPHRRIRVGAPPRKDRGAIDDEIACADEPTMPCHADEDDQECLGDRCAGLGGAPAWAARFHCCDGLGTRGRPCASGGRPQASASAGQLTSHSCTS
jgi:hypothetical protein